MAQIRQVVSESLQATIRRLLPSQQGFTEDLQASNVITPIIDLTPTAEGSQVRADLQTALAFGSQTAWTAINQTTVIANTAGFYRIWGGLVVMQPVSGNPRKAIFNMSNGFSTKEVFELHVEPSAGDNIISETVDFTVFLAAGDSISAVSDSAFSLMHGSVRQIADVNGNLVNPSGFTPS